MSESLSLFTPRVRRRNHALTADTEQYDSLTIPPARPLHTLCTPNKAVGSRAGDGRSREAECAAAHGPDGIGGCRMVRFEENVVIRRPLEEVFAFISDLENDPPWTSAAEVRRTSEGPIGLGTTFYQRARFVGRSVELSFEVVAYEPNHLITVAAKTGALSVEGSRAVDIADDGATRVTASGGGHARGVLRVAEPLLAAIGARQLRSMLARLKELLEVST